MADWIDGWLGAARFAPYVAAVAGDRWRALELYEWNVALGASLMHDIAHFEVAMRNAYDAAISARWDRPEHWLLSPESPAVMPIWRVREVDSRTKLKRGVDVNYANRKAVDRAIDRSGRGAATPGKVIAELSFGFWSHLSTSSHEKALWVPYLHHAYPKRTNRKDPDLAVSRINVLRNRIAHHEPIFDRRVPDQGPANVHRDLVRVLGMLAPEVQAHVVARSTVAGVIAERP